MLKNHLDPTIVSTGPTINTSLELTDGRTYTTKHNYNTLAQGCTVKMA